MAGAPSEIKFRCDTKPKIQSIELICENVSVTFREMILEDYLNVRNLVPSKSLMFQIYL